MRVVVTHDFFETFGGAERVTAEIAATFPDAPVHAILGRPAIAERMGIADRIHAILPPRRRILSHYRILAPLYPAIVRAARLPPADLIISSSYAYALAFESTGPAHKLCYCHGPLRHLWSQTDTYAAHLPAGAVGRAAFALYTGPARAADRAAARSVDAFLTQSPFTAGLIEKAYGRHADVLPPPVDARLFTPAEGPPQDYFLFVGRLVEAYKRPSLVVEAFRRMPDQRLLIAGDGPALQSLRRQASDNVEFLGALEDSELVAVMQACRAALFPSIDDYGLVPLEVNACGRPVLALPAGGSLHTVVEGVTGEFLERQSTEAIVQAVRAFDEARYDSEIIRQHAMRWSTDSFREQLRAAALRVVEGVRENATLDDAGAAEGR